MEPVVLEVVSSSSEVVRDPAGSRTRSRRAAAKFRSLPAVPHPGFCRYCVGPYLFSLRPARRGTSRISAIDAWRISSTVTPRLQCRTLQRGAVSAEAVAHVLDQRAGARKAPPPIAVVLIDRPVHHADVIAIEGDSYRRCDAETDKKSRRAKKNAA